MAKLASALTLITALGGALAVPASGSTAIWHFGYTGGVQTWVVPDGVTSARFDLYGAAGGEPHSAGFPAGKGGRASARVEVTPGSTISIVVGGKGGYPGAGYNGGGEGRRFGGGGATDVRVGGTALVNRLIVAGGGGGVGNYGGDSGGAGGGLTGTSGHGGFGGGGGTQTAGGSGTYPIWSGSFGQGGPGANAGPNVTGGGGGGWYGGAGGPGGGGGGSGHGPDRTHFESGVSGGNGSATILIGPARGNYRGHTEHTNQRIAFHLSHDYSTVTDFQWGDHIYFKKTTFHQAGDKGSFDHWDAQDMHYWAHWNVSRAFATGGLSYNHHGHRIVRHWTASAQSPSD
jgi:hypothetical protein